MPGPSYEDRVRERAYELWVEEGRPEGHDQEHWRRARDEIEAEDADLARNPGIGSSIGRQGDAPGPLDGESTFEGDVMNDTTPGGGIDPRQRGRTNK